MPQAPRLTVAQVKMDLHRSDPVRDRALARFGRHLYLDPALLVTLGTPAGMQVTRRDFTVLITN